MASTHLEFLILILVSWIWQMNCAPHIPRFSSHVSFATPARSFFHGVGDVHPPPPLHSTSLHGNFRQNLPKLTYGSYRSLSHDPFELTTLPFRSANNFQGYPRLRPVIPFQLSLPYTSPGSHSNVLYGDNSLGHAESYTASLLPPSPYRVDSPNAESLWPEGLLIPPSQPTRYTGLEHGSPHNNFIAYNVNTDHNIIEQGIDAVEAVARTKTHGLFHHEIPHVRALLANQELRIANGLQPHRLGSIRHSSPWYRT